MDIITTHLNADFDAFASMVAARRLYPRAFMVFPGSQERKVRDFIEVFRPEGLRRLKDIELSRVGRLIVVDTQSPERLGPLAELLGQVRVHVYDHHPAYKGALKAELQVVEPVGATATIFTEILRSRGLAPTPMEATLLSLGIHEETGSLLYPSSTDRDAQALAYLLRCGASLRVVAEFLRQEFRKDEFKVLIQLMEEAEDYTINSLKVRIAKATVEGYLGDAAHLAHALMEMEDVDALVVMLSMEGKVFLIGRSRSERLDIAQVLSEFGGGGHPQAASAVLKDMPLELIQERLLRVVKELTRAEVTASDVMTRPVITISHKSTVKEAEAAMTRYGVNVLPVLRGEKYLGIISREVVEKAIFHGFARSRVADFTSTDALTVEPQSPISAVEALMVERNQRFMPVLQDGRIVGAITRTDILRVMYEEQLRRAQGLRGGLKAGQPMERNLRRLLRERLSPGLLELLERAGRAAEQMGYGLYMVGGPVRDLLMGRSLKDIDLVVEGDAIAFARALGEELSASVKTHERFGTAQVVLPELKLDVATARTEYYESPAALPRVESSSIKKDLQRRDFTINTLAIKLNPKDFGLLVDFFGGRRDLRERTIRVLHDLSFVEDPTRAFRAVRFAVRFGFKLSRHTEELIRTALRLSFFERLSGGRLYEELVLLLGEQKPLEALQGLLKYGLLEVIHPQLALTEQLQRVLKGLEEALLWYRLSFRQDGPEQAVLYLTALLSGLAEQQRLQAMKRLNLSERLQRKIQKDISQAREALRRLPEEDPAALYEALEGLSLEALLLAMALSSAEQQRRDISRYLLELRKVRPLLRGEDLKAMGFAPGPVFSRILRSLQREKLRGRLKSRQEEEAFVRAHFKPSTSCMS